ncbi:MAG: 3-phosphoshikimate 1-carboxyvinyltransferase [Candidatus Heimdallarchaeota archaeon]
MIKVHETPRLSGEIHAPPSKSYTHRAIIMASLANGKSEIINPLICRDTNATIAACQEFGAIIDYKREEKLEIIREGDLKTPQDVINVENSGTTMRIMSAVAALAPGTTILTGDRSIRTRPMAPLLDALRELGVYCWSSKNDGLPPVIIKGGGIRGGETRIPGDQSSQFITALLIVTPFAEKDVEITLTTPLVSSPYVQITMKMLLERGIEVYQTSTGFRVPGNQIYLPKNELIPGDYSSASFIMAAAALTESEVRIRNLTLNARQGDAFIIQALRTMGAEIQVNPQRKKIIIKGGNPLIGATFDCSSTPDLLPILGVLGAFAQGETKLINCPHARLKESDRINTTTTELRRLGVTVKEESDGITIQGAQSIRGGRVKTYGDHRIAMAFAVAGLSSKTPIVIDQPEVVSMSYPRFFEDLKELGAKIECRD